MHVFTGDAQKPDIKDPKHKFRYDIQNVAGEKPTTNKNIVLLIPLLCCAALQLHTLEFGLVSTRIPHALAFPRASTSEARAKSPL